MKIRLSDDDSQFWALKVSLVTITLQSYNTDVGLTDQSTTELLDKNKPHSFSKNMGTLNKLIFVTLFHVLLEMNWFAGTFMIVTNKFIIKETFINFEYDLKLNQ